MPSECSEPCFFIPLHSFIAFSSPHRDPAATQAEAGGTKPWCFSLAPLSRTLCEPNSPAEVYLVCLRGEEGAERALCCSRVGAGWKHLLPVSSSVTSVQMEARCTEPGADHRSSVVVWLIPLDTRTHPGHSTRGLGGCSCTWLRQKTPAPSYARNVETSTHCHLLIPTSSSTPGAKTRRGGCLRALFAATAAARATQLKNPAFRLSEESLQGCAPSRGASSRQPELILAEHSLPHRLRGGGKGRCVAVRGAACTGMGLLRREAWDLAAPCTCDNQ